MAEKTYTVGPALDPAPEAKTYSIGPSMEDQPEAIIGATPQAIEAGTAGLPAPHGVPRISIFPPGVAPPISGPAGPQAQPIPAPPPNRIKAIVGAFGQGFGEGFNPQERLGLSDASTQFLQRVGVFAGADDKLFRPLKTFNEQLIGSAAITLDAGIRATSGVYRGLQGIATEMGLPKDIASLPDAFAGSPETGMRPTAAAAKPKPIEWPEPTVLRPPESYVRPTPLAPIKGSLATPGVSRSVAAQTGIPEVDSIINHPVTKAVIDNPVIDRTRDVPYMGGGSEKLNDATVYIDRHVPRTQTVKGITFDPADPWVVHENVEQATMERLIKGDMDEEEAYRVAHFEFAEKAEQAWYRAHGIDQVAAEKEQLSWLPKIQHENPANPPPNLYAKPYPHASVRAAEHESVEEAPPSPAEIAHAMNIIRNDKELQPQQGALPAVEEARQLGVIGPDRPDLATLSPEDARKEVVARGRNPEAAPRPGEPAGPQEQPSEWRKRFRETLDKMQTPADARALLENAIDKSGDEFAAVRQGELTPAQLATVSEAFGIDPADVNPIKTGTLIKTNAQIENAIQAIRTLDERTKFIAEQIAAKAGVADEAEVAGLIKLTMQRDALTDAALVPFIALRAEFGRTGNVIQQFMELQKQESSIADFLKTKGTVLKSVDDVRTLAKLIAETPAEALPTALTKMREPTIGPIYYSWVQGLISGILTHTKYVEANEVYALYERGAVTPLAAILNKGRYLGVPGRAEKVQAFKDQIFLGEAVAGVVGQYTSVPLAFIGAAQTVKAGVRVPLEDEMALYAAAKARGEKVPRPIEKVLDAFGQPQERPIGGVSGRIVGAPGDVASGIHAFYKLRGREAAMQALAYRETVKEGMHPMQPGFFARMQWHAANPSEEMRHIAIAEAYKSTFVEELGTQGKRWSTFVKGNPVLKWVFPFSHIPINLTKAIIENTPAQVLDRDMRDDLLGKNGGVAESKAMARVTLGSSVMGWVAWKALNGQATGDYPTDPDTRQDWIATGKQPNSWLIGNEWVSFDKFGPAGSLASLGANIAQVIQRAQKPDDDAMTQATWQAAVAAARLISDQVGFMSLAMMYEATLDEKKGQAWAASTAATFATMPISSLLRQTASEADPYVREVKTFLDGIKYAVPELRDTLLPKLDVLGDPIPNPQYGSIIRRSPLITDPVITEMHRLDIHLAAPRDSVKEVKLPPGMYHEYEIKAGALTRAAITSWITQPFWPKMPFFVQQEILKKTIEASRQAAGAQMMMKYRDIINQGYQQKLNKFNGEPPPPPLRDGPPFQPTGILGIRG